MADVKQMTPDEEKVQEDRLIRSRVQMLMAFPFFGILALNLKMECTYNVPTAATDGSKFYYNPNFIKGLSEGELNWVVVHEVLHPALKHLWRKGDRMHEKWNFACDYAIHDIMMDFKDAAKSDAREKLQMPKNCLYDPKYHSLSAEEIYDMLPQNPQQNAKYGNGQSGQGQGQQGQGQGTLDDHSMWDNKDAGGAQENGQQKAQEWEGRIVSAAKAAESKAAGNLPGFLKRLLNKLTKPQKDWRVLLAEFVEPETDDYSFNPPDRRFSDQDFMLPDLNDQVQCVKKIVFWIDTSGSIGDKELTVAYSEIVGAIGQFQGKLSGFIGFFDHAAYGLKPFEDVDDVLEAKPEGGGGTSFHAPFEWIKDNMEEDEIAGIIMLTDGYASWPDEKIANSKPVLWLINNEDVVPPWGLHTTIKV
jgi:predicted metal-dependent peptidase